MMRLENILSHIKHCSASKLRFLEIPAIRGPVNAEVITSALNFFVSVCLTDTCKILH